MGEEEEKEEEEEEEEEDCGFLELRRKEDANIANRSLHL